MAKITFDKLQHIYDLHAADFGLTGDKNLQELKKLGDRIEMHLTDAATQAFQGYYRGDEAKLYYNLHTGNVVITDWAESIVAAFRASPAQAGYIRSTGRLN